MWPIDFCNFLISLLSITSDEGIALATMFGIILWFGFTTVVPASIMTLLITKR